MHGEREREREREREEGDGISFLYFTRVKRVRLRYAISSNAAD